MAYIKLKIWAGDVYECIQTFCVNYGNHKGRKKKVGKSTIKQILLNEKNSKRKLTRLINANFTMGDLFITLSYLGEEPTIEQARKDLVNFLRRVKYYRKRNRLSDVKYIATTEYMEQRTNHHIIMSAMSWDIIQELWMTGKVYITRLYDKDYVGIANYITKERKKAFSRRWTQSRNLQKPKVEAEPIKNGQAEVRAPKGYKVVEKSLNTTDMGYFHQYVKAIRMGGRDYGEGETGAEKSGALDTGGLPKAHRKGSGKKQVPK